MEQRHLLKSIHAKGSSLSRCFQSYLKFHKEEKNVVIQSCNKLNITKSGKVYYAKVFGSRIPKDFAMCLEQEFYRMNFKALQLDQSTSITFPVNFKK